MKSFLSISKNEYNIFSKPELSLVVVVAVVCDSNVNACAALLFAFFEG